MEFENILRLNPIEKEHLFNTLLEEINNLCIDISYDYKNHKAVLDLGNLEEKIIENFKNSTDELGIPPYETMDLAKWLIANRKSSDLVRMAKILLAYSGVI